MVETCLLGLREAARIVNVVREQGATTASTEALVVWAESTAARGVRGPRPRIGLELLEKLGLVDIVASDKVDCTPLLAGDHGPTGPVIDRFPADIAPTVLQRMLHTAELASEIAVVLRHCRICEKLATVRWALVPPEFRASPAWLWLQTLGLARQVEDGLSIDDRLLPFLADVVRPKVPISQEDLDLRLTLQRARADLAEELVMRAERERLVCAGADDLAEGVQRISVDDVTAGYDIRSFELSGDLRLIEVKSSAGPRERFFLSDNERDTASLHGPGYWLAWVGWAANLPDGNYELHWFQDLTRLLGLTASPWRVSSSGTVIERIQDDTHLCAKH